MSSKQYHKVHVRDVIDLTKDTKGVVLDIPDELKMGYQYTQGQYLNFRKNINGEEVVRSYSLYTSPSEGEWAVAVKRVENGKFSGYVHEDMRPGESIDVMTPGGNFFVDLDPTKSNRYVAFAAGSGITPIMSIIKTTLEMEEGSVFTLFYGNRKSEDIIFKEELNNLKNDYLDRFRLYHFLSKEDQEMELFNGRISDEKCKQMEGTVLFPNKNDHYFLCGPGSMIMSVKDFLLDKGVDKSQIHFELFNTLGLETSDAAEEDVAKTSSENTEVTVILDGEVSVVEMPQGEENIIDTGNNLGLDLPYSCKAGVCCTCRAKVLEGSVHMEVNYALEEDEVEDGYILCCQSNPTSAKLTLSFDE